MYSIVNQSWQGMKVMKKADAIKFFGSGSEMARQLGVTKGAVSQWGEELDYPRQCQIQVVSRGKLRAEEAK